VQSADNPTTTRLRILTWTSMAVAVGLFASCDTPGVTLDDPDVAGGTDRSWTITVRLEDSSLAAALGWSDGVPGATVSRHRILEEYELTTAITDSIGQVRFERVLPGQFRIAAQRVLRPDETAATNGLIRAFGDGKTVWKDKTVLDLNLRADRAGSLVVSEIRTSGRYAGPDWPDYRWFQYFELYNNADTTLYLDGMLWGESFSVLRDGVRPCVATESFRNDPLGLWAARFHQFPGRGSDYPVAPGHTVLVALDAIDHSVIHPNLPDLTAADFELEGTVDADNPDVPNMPWAGPRIELGADHGLWVQCAEGPCFLAQAVDLEALERRQDPSWGFDYVRIPSDAVLDVVTAGIWAPHIDQIADPCATVVPRSMDRLEFPYRLLPYDATLSLSRKFLHIGGSGHPILQDVGVSFVDFAEVPRSPGWIEH
jgi:hypothetical protein